MELVSWAAIRASQDSDWLFSCEEDLSDGRRSAAFALSAKNLSNSAEWKRARRRQDG